MERQRLSRELIISEALALIDSEGLERCTMARLGERLGVTDMAFYRYFASRDELIEQVVVTGLEMMPLPDRPASGDGLSALRDVCSSWWHLFSQHPHVLPAMIGQPLSLPVMQQRFETTRALLIDAGWTGDDADMALATVTAHMFGYAVLVCGGYPLGDNVFISEAAPRPRSLVRPTGVCQGLTVERDWDVLGKTYAFELEIVLKGIEQQRVDEKTLTA